MRVERERTKGSRDDGRPGIASVVAVAVALAGCARRTATAERPMEQHLPEEVMGWRGEAPPRRFDPTTVFRYLDGGAEIYVAYGMRSLMTRRYERPGAPAITVDLFEMAASEGAFGAFTFEREGRDAGVGQGSDYAAGMLRFWKGTYFASVLAEEETAESGEAVLEIGRRIAATIGTIGAVPTLVDMLPPEGLDEASVRYVVSADLLDHVLPLDERTATERAGRVLGLVGRAEAVSGRYAPDRARLAIVTHLDAAGAHAAVERLDALPQPSRRPGRAPEPGPWSGAHAVGRMVVLVSRASDRDRGEALMAAAAARLEAS